MVGAWKSPQWCRVVQVPDPSLDATYQDRDGNTRHQRIAVIWEFFPDEQTATEVGAAELAKRAEKQVEEAEPVETNGEPNLPSEWAGFHDDWIAMLKESLAKPGAVIDGVQQARDDRDVAADLTVGVPFVKTWRRFLEAQK